MRRFLLPYGLAVKDHALEAASPDGDELLTSLTGLGTQRATVIKTATGRHSRTFKNPALRGVEDLPASESEWTAGQPVVAWGPFAPALMIGYGRMRIFDAHALKSSRTLRSAGRDDNVDLSARFLASGRVLLAIRNEDEKRAASRLFISDVKRSRFTKLDTSRLGAVSSVACSASASGRMFLAVAGTGVVYEIAANTIDDSPLRASS